MTTGKPTDIPQDVWEASRAVYYAVLDSEPVTGHSVEIIARAILAERERIGALVEQKAQAFTDSRNPLASELVAALDDLRLCIARGEVA